MMEDQTFKLGQVVRVQRPQPFVGYTGVVQQVYNDVIQVAFSSISKRENPDGITMLWFHVSALEAVKK